MKTTSQKHKPLSDPSESRFLSLSSDYPLQFAEVWLSANCYPYQDHLSVSLAPEPRHNTPLEIYMRGYPEQPALREQRCMLGVGLISG